eukprot:gene8386-66686_t
MAFQQCDFTQCGDKQGVIAWLGKKKGTAEYVLGSARANTWQHE